MVKPRFSLVLYLVASIYWTLIFYSHMQISLHYSYNKEDAQYEVFSYTSIYIYIYIQKVMYQYVVFNSTLKRRTCQMKNKFKVCMRRRGDARGGEQGEHSPTRNPENLKMIENSAFTPQLTVSLDTKRFQILFKLLKYFLKLSKFLIKF